MSVRALLVLSTLGVFLTGTTFAEQADFRRIAIVPMTIDQGFPLKVVVTEKFSSKLNEPVHGKIVDPVFAFDREVIPAGTEILGRVTALRPVGKWKRVSSMLGGDFTPLHDPEITFDTLVMPDGKQIPIETSVAARKAFITAFQEPGKDLAHRMLWSLSPYHPQVVPAGTAYKASLVQPLEFGNAFFGTSVLNGIGSEPSPGSIIYARLTTEVDTKKTKAESAVEAVLTYPLYSPDHRLIFPAGSRVHGEVVSVHPAGFLRHGGELAVAFKSIEPPLAIMFSKEQRREIHGRLIGVETPVDLTQLKIDDDGAAQVPSGKERFLAPAFALAGAAPMLNGGSSSFGAAFAEAYGSSAFSRALGGSAGFGLPAGIAGLMAPPVGLGLGAYGVGHAVYSSILGRGKNITLPAGTSIEIRVDRGNTESD